MIKSSTPTCNNRNCLNRSRDGNEEYLERQADRQLSSSFVYENMYSNRYDMKISIQGEYITISSLV